MLLVEKNPSSSESAHVIQSSISSRNSKRLSFKFKKSTVVDDDIIVGHDESQRKEQKSKRKSSSSEEEEEGKKEEMGSDPLRVCSDAQLRRLKQHKYSATSVSLLDPVLQHWWNWLVNQIPFWLAPNLITSLGLLVNVLSSLILVYYSPDCQQPVSV